MPEGTSTREEVYIDDGDMVGEKDWVHVDCTGEGLGSLFATDLILM